MESGEGGLNRSQLHSFTLELALSSRVCAERELSADDAKSSF